MSEYADTTHEYHRNDHQNTLQDKEQEQASIQQNEEHSSVPPLQLFTSSALHPAFKTPQRHIPTNFNPVQAFGLDTEPYKDSRADLPPYKHTAQKKNNQIIQFEFTQLSDVKNDKLIPTNSDFSEAQKLKIINWMFSDNNNSNALKQVYKNDYQHNYTTTANNIKYTFTFDWDLAMHIDFGGAAHGGVDTPHLQAVGGLIGMAGTTAAAVTITKDSGDNVDDKVVAYNDSDNAVGLDYAQSLVCMANKSLNSVKTLIRPKLKSFGESWASTFADKNSGAKDLRMNEEVEMPNLFGNDDSDDDSD